MDEVSTQSPVGRTHRPAAPAYAALDLGTNNCRMLVGTPCGDGFRVIDSFSRIVRLGEGLQGSGLLSSSAMERALVALHACADRLGRRAPVRALRAVATEACRRATNGPAFLARVRLETDLPVDIISAREEAELALESCGPLLRGIGRRALVFDIGGGSTELGWVRLSEEGGASLIGYATLPLGVVTLGERFGHAGFDPEGYEAMVEYVEEQLAPFDRVHCIAHEIRCGGVGLLGTSGTVTTLAGVAMNLPRYRRPLIDGAVLDLHEAADAVRQLRELGRRRLEGHPCVGPDRVDLVLPGCAIYEAITRTWPARQVTVADRGLREGILLRMIRADRRRRFDQRRHDTFVTAAHP